MSSQAPPPPEESNPQIPSSPGDNDSAMHSRDLLKNPSIGKLNNHFILGEMIDHLSPLFSDTTDADLDLLTIWLTNVRNHQVDTESTLRSLLHVFWKTEAFQKSYGSMDEDTKAKVSAFSEGKSVQEILSNVQFEPKPTPHSHHRFRFLDFMKSLVHHENGHTAASLEEDIQRRQDTFSIDRGLPVIYEDKESTKVMEVYSDVPFENWANVSEITNTPSLTFVPTKILGIQNLMQFAIKHNLRVRCAGYRHSYDPIFSDDGQILVSMLNLEEATKLPDPLVILPLSPANAYNDFKTIDLVQEINGKALVRIGSAVTLEELRRWATKNGNWTLPVDTIIAEVTVGGTNGTICHGAGYRHQTINDQVRAIEYVDSHGVHRTISDQTGGNLLEVAAGCFGLLGVVTHITYEFDAMTYAILKPRKIDVGLAIPPLSLDDVPLALQKTITKEQFQDALSDFEKRASEDYYAEWFWFPYQSTVWVNTWNNTKDSTGSRDYTSPIETFLEWVQLWLGGVITSTKLFQAIPGRWQAQLLASITMALLPPTIFQSSDLEIKTQLPNGQHFRRDDHNMRVRDMEWEIPIPAKSGTDQPDWDVVRKAWWQVINLVYTEVDSPLRLTLEMRIVKDSNVLMAPFRGNKFGTASIEVLTLPDAVTDDEWLPFVKKVTEGWMSLAEEGKVRPHWGKEWYSVEIEGSRPLDYMKTKAYRDEIPIFKKGLAEIGQSQGWELADLKKRFSNKLWDELIFFDID